MPNSIFKSANERLRFALLGDKDALMEIGYKTPKQVKKAYRHSVLLKETKDVKLLKMFIK